MIRLPPEVLEAAAFTHRIVSSALAGFTGVRDAVVTQLSVVASCTSCALIRAETDLFRYGVYREASLLLRVSVGPATNPRRLPTQHLRSHHSFQIGFASRVVSILQ